mmetsp:Transcript_22618/g.62778  ORF Transcript_22618/g.62778 Transcript_22618/m.62778 type:complete len:426 (-) Transcript_22618:343-1620(-)|eukprot:CAMPEP_0117671054 /NCGR_PEP_ID=MMETSP0804-20121206/13113_1 /TAXON_ID=1074897 /ORGANISM="Tetraselmis astigmatica, Strain CCMP880" /LENGTH=425 /DNA_ID=CAMNT_0005479457 /DNA_START=92 /DNA_END=1369 /DNA_ORIENTATION=+
MSGQDQEDAQQPKAVGRGLNPGKYSVKDTQWHLAGSNHPYAPFPGNAMKWKSFIYDDGTSYEGLMRENTPHVKGTVVIGNGTAAGFQKPDFGDIYEGEFEAGYAHGLGQYIGAKGEIYRGEFRKGQRNGCGVLINMKPYLKRIQKGDSPEAAWAATREKIETSGTTIGTWQSDLFLTGPSEDASFCHFHEIRGVQQELESVITRTRMFRHKPDGDVTIALAFRDDRGIPITTYQDPLHYPHGTGFLAPGPMGQTFPIPDHPELKAAMSVTARNHERIWKMYNFPEDPAPGTDLYNAEKLMEQEMEERRKQIKEMQAAEKRRLRRLERIRSVEKQASDTQGPDGEEPPADEDDGEDIDDEDLTVASADPLAQSSKPRGRPGFGGPTAFGSISLGMSRASQVVGNALAFAASRAPRRPRLTRPSDLM